MSPATRKSKRTAAVAAAKQVDLPEEAEERAPKKQKEEPQTEIEPPLHLEHPQTEQKQVPDESIDAQAEAEAEAEAHAPPQSIDTGTAEASLNRAEETEEQVSEGNRGEEQFNELAVGDGGEQEEGDDKQEAEEVEQADDRIQLGDTGDDGIGDDEDVEEPGSTQEADEKQGDDGIGDDEDVEEPGSTLEADEKQGDDATATAQNNGAGATTPTTSSRQDDEAFSSQGKIFIGGLTWETTADTLQNHFGKYGEITDSVVMKNRSTGHPRGFGFVTFADPLVCDTVLKDTHVIDGRTVEAKQIVPREKGPASSKVVKSKKIFVGGLTTTTTEEELKAYFEKFGKVSEHQIMQDHKTGRSRGFGFVTFESEDVVDNILSQGRLLELGGKQVEVKIAEPKRAGQESFGGSSNSSRPFGGRGGGNSGGHGTYNPYLGRGGRAGGGRPMGPSYGSDTHRYGGGYSAMYAYGGIDGGYAGMSLNYPGFGSGAGYGYDLGSYTGNARGYGGRYHPYGR